MVAVLRLIDATGSRSSIVGRATDLGDPGEEGFDRGRAHRTGEQEPLPVATAEIGEEAGLVGVLDPLGDHLEIQRPAEVDDGTRDRRSGAAGGGDEGPVDLEDVDRESLEIAQRE